MSSLVPGAALVTGGGSGIGRASAVMLAARGAAVAVVDLQPAGGQETVRTIAAAGGKAAFVQADAGRWEDVDRAVGEAVAAVGPLGILVNAAGILDGYSPVEETAPELWDRVIGINLSGTFYFCRRALPEILKNGGGRIVNIASTAGLIGDGGGVAYIASKHGVVGLTRQMGVTYAERGLNVNAVCPGPIATNLRSSSMAILGPGAPEMATIGFSTPERLKAGIPANRRGSPEEIAAAVCFLASDEAAFITGHTLVVDGGWTAR